MKNYFIRSVTLFEYALNKNIRLISSLNDRTRESTVQRLSELDLHNQMQGKPMSR